MSIKKKELKIEDLNKNNISVDLNPSLNFYHFDELISDWSGIFIEYIFIKLRKPHLIDTSQKILNNDISPFSQKPAELKFRENYAYNYKNTQLTNLLDNILKIKNEEKNYFNLDNLMQNKNYFIDISFKENK